MEDNMNHDFDNDRRKKYCVTKRENEVMLSYLQSGVNNMGDIISGIQLEEFIVNRINEPKEDDK